MAAQWIISRRWRVRDSSSTIRKSRAPAVAVLRLTCNSQSQETKGPRLRAFSFRTYTAVQIRSIDSGRAENWAAAACCFADSSHRQGSYRGWDPEWLVVRVVLFAAG